MNAVSIRHLSKRYRVWPRPRDMLVETIFSTRRRAEFQALTDVCFDVPRGSVVGIMGRNGAGKSTLLRIVAGTLDASEGTVEVQGRVAAILELGSGFHPDYTGRENVFLGGLCLGMKRAEIVRHFDDIVDFAEVGDFIDLPFRTFSSGMQARLTFAVATCVDPDVLIIDEALSVGDARFQLKSFDRVREFRRRGKSILLVSHDLNQIAAVCDQAIVLDKGRVLASGDPHEVTTIYHELLFGGSASTRTALPEMDRKRQAPDEVPIPNPTQQDAIGLRTSGQFRAANETAASMISSGARACSPVKTNAPVPKSREHRYGDGAARIDSIEVHDHRGQPVSRLQSLGEYDLVCRIRAERTVRNLCFGWLLRDRRGLDLFGWDMRTGACAPIPEITPQAPHELSVRFRANMAAGQYFITVALARWDTHKHDVRFDALEITVEPTSEIFTTSVVNLEPRLQRELSVRQQPSGADEGEPRAS